MKNNVIDFKEIKENKEYWDDNYDFLIRKLSEILPIMRELKLSELTLYDDGYMEYSFKKEE